MFDYFFLSEEDKEWLKENYSNLEIHAEDGIEKISGILNFSMALLEGGKSYIINPNPNIFCKNEITDQYQIQIELRRSEFSNLPQVFETGFRIERIAIARNLKLVDLHINPNKSACLCIKPEEPLEFNVKDFFNNLLIPFFYGQSFFEKFNRWPWKEYAHGPWGLIEWVSSQGEMKFDILDDFLKNLKRSIKLKEEEKIKERVIWDNLKAFLNPNTPFKGHNLCVCGKKELIRRCHPDILKGIWKLKAEIERLNYKIDNIH